MARTVPLDTLKDLGAPMICARAMVGGLFALLTMTSCGGDGDRAPGEVLEGDSGKVKVLVNAEPDDRPIAGIGYGGRVELVGDCLGFGGNTIIWPYGTEIVSDDPLVVDVPGEGQVTIGDKSWAERPITGTACRTASTPSRPVARPLSTPTTPTDEQPSRSSRGNGSLIGTTAHSAAIACAWRRADSGMSVSRAEDGLPRQVYCNAAPRPSS